MKKKTPQGERLAEVIKDMGHTERSFAIYAGYKHASTIYASEHVRDIGPKLTKKVIDSYVKILSKNLNPDWLLKGTNPKLLTIYEEPFEPEKLNNEKKCYQINCINCAKKDEEIKKLTNELLDLHRQYNECLKELFALKKISFG